MNTRSSAPVLSTLLAFVFLVHANGVSAQSGATYKVDPGWAQLPQGTSWNGNTTWITADGKGNVVVLVRTAPYFRVFTRDGKFVKAFGDDGLFESAHSVTIDPQGFLWVTDSAAHVVHKFSPDGRLLMTLGRRGVVGDNTSLDLFNQPNHVAVAPNGDIYVSDGYVNARVVHFTSQGQFVRIIGGVKGSQSWAASASTRRCAGFPRQNPGQRQRQPEGVGLRQRGEVRRDVAVSLSRRHRRGR